MSANRPKPAERLEEEHPGNLHAEVKRTFQAFTTTTDLGLRELLTDTTGEHFVAILGARHQEQAMQFAAKFFVAATKRSYRGPQDRLLAAQAYAAGLSEAVTTLTLKDGGRLNWSSARMNKEVAPSARSLARSLTRDSRDPYQWASELRVLRKAALKGHPSPKRRLEGLTSDAFNAVLARHLGRAALRELKARSTYPLSTRR